MGLRITAWRDQEEWLYVRSCLYPEQHLDALAARTLGLSRISAWTIRGRVPHSVVSTAMLTSALIRDQSGQLNPLETRMMIAMAITRFVNGLLDPAQQAVYAISIASLARTIGLPEIFVEIRHSATHDVLPSLPVLRSSVVQALDWLWQNYWKIPKIKHKEKDVEYASRLGEQLDSLLKSWRKLRKDDPSRPIKTGDPEVMTKQSISLLKQLRQMKDSPMVIAAMTERLLAPKILLSSSPRAHDIWKPFLDCANQTFPRLRSELIRYGVSILSGVGSEGWSNTVDYSTSIKESPACASIPNVEGSYDRLLAWMLELLEFGPDHQNALDVKEITRALSFAEDPYTMKIMHHLNGTSHFGNLDKLIAIRNGVFPITTAKKPEEDSVRLSEPLQVDPAENGKAITTTSGTGDSFISRVGDVQSLPIGFLIGQISQPQPPRI